MRIEGTVTERPARIKTRHVRAQLQLTQEQLRDKSGVSLKTISEIENRRRPIGLNTAYALLNAFNELRRDRGWPELAIEDLDWNISGESEA